MFIAEVKEENAQWMFMEDLRNIDDDNLRPLTPSRIPVGNSHLTKDGVEQDIIHILINEMNGDGCTDSKRNSRSRSPTPSSRIPVGDWRNKTTAYKNMMERQEKNASSVYLSNSCIKTKHNLGGRLSLKDGLNKLRSFNKGSEKESVVMIMSDLSDATEQGCNNMTPFKSHRQRSRSVEPSRANKKRLTSTMNC